MSKLGLFVSEDVSPINSLIGNLQSVSTVVQDVPLAPATTIVPLAITLPSLPEVVFAHLAHILVLLAMVLVPAPHAYPDSTISKAHAKLHAP